jgi:hypothetical protein
MHFGADEEERGSVDLRQCEGSAQHVLMPWQFSKRKDGKIAITLDNNVWDFLFVRNIDLAAELPAGWFALYVTREVEIETLAIPDNGHKRALKAYITKTIEECRIQTTYVFGFASNDSPGPIRVGGFDQGVWQSRTESEYYAAIRERFLTGRPQRKSELSVNEGDAAIGAQSFFSIALTCENPSKNGPLRSARENGGAVLYLPDFDKSGRTLSDFIEAFYRSL